MKTSHLTRLFSGVLILAMFGGRSAVAEDNPLHAGLHPTYGPPILLQNSGCVLIPFGADDHFVPGTLSMGPAFFVGDTPASAIGSQTSFKTPLSMGSSFDTGTIYWNNLIIFNSRTKQSEVMLSKPAVVSRMIIPRTELKTDAFSPPAYLLFLIADTDTNNDGVIDSKDIARLYVSDPEGHDLVAATPAGSKVIDVALDASGTNIFVQLAQNNTADKDGDTKGVATILRVDPLHPNDAAPLIDDGITQKALRAMSP